MGLRLLAAASLVALAPFVAGAAQAGVVLMSFSASPDGGSVTASSQPSMGIEAGPGSLSFALTGVITLVGFQPDEAAPAVALGAAPTLQTISSLGAGDKLVAKPAVAGGEATQPGPPPKAAAVTGVAAALSEGVGAAAIVPAMAGGSEASQESLPPKAASVTGVATALIESGGGASNATPLAPAPGGQTLVADFTPAVAPPQWKDVVDEGLDARGGASGLADQIVASVPEPASWALMTLGFGGLGAMLRRQRRLGAARAVAV
jgi:hypothetical protein